MGQQGSSVSSRAYLADVAEHCIQAHALTTRTDRDLVGNRLRHKAHIVQDGGQEIVEVVRHAPGKLTETLQPVGLVQLRFSKIALVLDLRARVLTTGFDAITGVADGGREKGALFGVN